MAKKMEDSNKKRLIQEVTHDEACLLYTSDAADE